MRILVTGANGFIGQALTARLLYEADARRLPLDTLVLLDKSFAPAHYASHSNVIKMIGDIADPALLRESIGAGVDLAFHLASVPGGLAERDQGLGRRVNLEATVELFEQLGHLAAMPVVVFASSVAVYGASLPAQVDEHTPPRPGLTYGAHKLVGEILLRDLTRRGRIDGRALRLPGVVARPRAPSGLMSAYMSEIMHACAAGETFTCPVSPQATSWWMSARCCVDNLLHAARLPAGRLDQGRTWALPVLHASMAELVDALVRSFGEDRRGCVRYAPDPALEAAFGAYPPLLTPTALALGFAHDGNLDALVRNALG